MAKIYYIGDWAVTLGPTFAETPFNHAVKGIEIFNYGTWLKEALESTAEHQVDSVATWDFYHLEPGAWERILAEYDIIIFSDVELKNFQLAPRFFDKSQFGKEPLTFPDRVRLTVEAMRDGTHMMFLGGWLSFNGECGKGGWGRSRLKEILPVRCLPYEDLIESTEGYCGKVQNRLHPIFNEVDISETPPILGYNKVKPREGCEVLATWGNTEDPMLAVGQFGKGRSFAYTSDPAPHWGLNFVYWDGYARFWLNAVVWLMNEDDT